MHCRFFDEALVYFFYGRPAYRPKSWKKENAPAVLPFMPCSIVLKPDALEIPKRIAPFDTGAWEEGRFESYMHPEMTIDDFLLHPSMDTPTRVVWKFFRSNHNYYYAKPHSIRIPPAQLEAQSYYELIKHRATQKLDDRGSAIEIQIDYPLPLTSKNLLYLVLPKIFYSDRAIRETIVGAWKIPAALYDIQAITLQEHMGIVYTEVEKFLSQMGLI
jgi:hypothetical protein